MRARSRQATITLGMALLGLCIAVALAILTSRLSTQRVGLAGESPQSGLSLVAPPSPKPKRHDTHRPGDDSSNNASRKHRGGDD